MITSCKFNKDRDIEKVVPDLEISISMAMTTGVIKDTATSAPYTNETDVDSVGNYIHDPIDVAMAAKAVNASLANAAMSSVVNEPAQGE